MNQIFICYRRDDSAAVAGRIYDRLSQKFGKSAIFKDVDSIPLGVNFRNHLDSVVKQCDVVLVLVGDKWLDDAKGIEKRRINNPRDFVRIEVESALRRDIPVIPLLIENAEMPSEDDLPSELKEFAYRNGMSIRHDPYFHRDMDRLIESLESVFDGSGTREKPNSPPISQSSRKIHDEAPFKASVELPVSEDQRGRKVLPFAVGIETLGGVFTKLIPEGSSLPLRHAEIFSTASDNQSSVEVSVFAGVRPLAKDNVSIGKFHLVGIPPAPRGMPQIEILFEIDNKGIVDVSAKDLGTGRQQKITITNLGPSKNDIERIMRDAYAHSMNDARTIEEIEARNRLDSLTYQVEKTVNENRGKVGPAAALEAEAAIAEAKKALLEGGVDRMNGSFNSLQTASHKLARTLY